MMEKKKKLPKAVKIIGIVLLALAVAWGGFTIASHAVYHRSNMATIVEIYFRVLGTKDNFADEEECAQYIEQRRNAEEYSLNVKLDSDIDESSVNGSRIYRLSQTDTPDYTILYLHGGAYINDASQSKCTSFVPQ